MTITDPEHAQTLTVADLPDFTHEPLGAMASAVRALVASRVSTRRTLFRMVSGAAVALGVAALELRPLRAAAVTLSVWGDCHGFINASTVCTPPSWYISGSLPCNGTWHRWDSYNDSFVSYSFQFYDTTCGGRNAWKWYGATGAGHSTLKRKCSDGHTSYADIGGTRIYNSSICRTAL